MKDIERCSGSWRRKATEDDCAYWNLDERQRENYRLRVARHVSDQAFKLVDRRIYRYEKIDRWLFYAEAIIFLLVLGGLLL